MCVRPGVPSRPTIILHEMLGWRHWLSLSPSLFSHCELLVLLAPPLPTLRSSHGTYWGAARDLENPELVETYNDISFVF